MATEHKLEHKTVKFKVKSFNEAQGIVEGYASTFDNEDLVGDVIMRGAFKKTIKENKNVKMYYNHEMFYRPPIGKWNELQENEKGLLAAGKISQTSQGKDIFTLLKDGVLDKMSIGYEVIKENIDRDKGIRYIKELRLYEISIVDYPANPEAVVTSVKGREEQEKQKKDLDETKQQVTELKQQIKSLEEKVSGLFSMMEQSQKNSSNQSGKQSLPDSEEPETSTHQVDGADIGENKADNQVNNEANGFDFDMDGLKFDLDEIKNRMKKLAKE